MERSLDSEMLLYMHFSARDDKLQIYDMKKIYFLGPEGSYSDIVVKRTYGSEYEPAACGSFAEIVRRTMEDAGSVGVLPIENSITSSVHENMDYLFKEDLRIVREAYLQIRLNLIGLAGVRVGDIREVYSHPKALSQCRRYILRHNFVAEETASTSAARDVVLHKADKRVAVIGSAELADGKELKILEENIGDEEFNVTRFLFVSRKDVELDSPSADASGTSVGRPFARKIDSRGNDKGVKNKSSVVFTLPHEPGSLAKILTELGKGGFNLTKIESRPIPATSWEYQFWVDIESDGEKELDERFLLEILGRSADSFKVMGRYVAGEENG